MKGLISNAQEAPNPIITLTIPYDIVLVFSVCWSPLSRDGKGPTYSSVCNQLILKMREGGTTSDAAECTIVVVGK